MDNAQVEFTALSFQELVAKYGEDGVAELANVALRRRAATRARMAKPSYKAKAQERRERQKKLLEWAKQQQDLAAGEAGKPATKKK